MPMMRPLPDLAVIHARLSALFPEGTPNRQYVVRELAASTVFVMLYVDAVEGAGTWLRPDQVTRMTDEQAEKRDPDQRAKWRDASMKSAKGDTPGQWYRTNTREPIRDETIRQGLVPVGAVLERPGLPTTSSLGRYALEPIFADLFDPSLSQPEFDALAGKWRDTHLSKRALAAIMLRKSAVTSTEDGVVAKFPNGETRRLAPGPSSNIAKAVIEEFAPRFLTDPGVLWLSESAKKEERRDADLADKLGLHIAVDKNLPDIILVDRPDPRSVLFVFVEVVATDGPVTEDRRAALLKLVTDAGYESKDAAFVTAYVGRGESAFRKTFASLARQSFAWCVTEPDAIIGLHSPHGSVKLLSLVARNAD